MRPANPCRLNPAPTMNATASSGSAMHVERRAQRLVRLGTELADRPGRRLARRDAQKRGQEKLGRLAGAVGAGLVQLGQIVGKLVEAQHGEVARARASARTGALRNAVEHHQPCAAPVPHQQRARGRVGHLARGVALVVNEDAEQLSLGASSAHIDGYAVRRLDEGALAQERHRDVAADLGQPVAHLALRQRHQPQRHQIHHRHDEQREHGDGAQDRGAAEARRQHHDDLAIAEQAVDRVEHSREYRDRQHDRQHRRQQQRREFQEHPRRLAVVDHGVDDAQRLRQPDHAGEDQHEEQERPQNLAEYVAVQAAHGSSASSPQSSRADHFPPVAGRRDGAGAGRAHRNGTDRDGDMDPGMDPARRIG